MFDTDHDIEKGGFFVASGTTDFEVRYIGRILLKDLPERMAPMFDTGAYVYFLSGDLLDTKSVLFFYENSRIFNLCMEVTDLETLIQIHGPFVCDMIEGIVEDDLFEVYSHINDREESN